MVFSSLKKEIMKGDSMQRSESLKKNHDFQKVYKNGTSKGNRYLVMYVLKNQYMKNRLGISVSKKVGNSVVRHRLTRLIRESYRLNEEKFDILILNEALENELIDISVIDKLTFV